MRPSVSGGGATAVFAESAVLRPDVSAAPPRTWRESPCGAEGRAAGATAGATRTPSHNTKAKAVIGMLHAEMWRGDGGPELERLERRRGDLRPGGVLEQAVDR
jgi:hypothetical protein